MKEKISYIKLPNITVSELQDVVDFLDDNGIEYVEYYVEDLQNRIDRAIEYIKIYRSYEKIDGKDYLKNREEIGSLSLLQVDDLLDILKESGE